MNYLRLLLLPFSAIFLVVTFLRNLFYNSGLFKSVSFTQPIIVVGNLSTGGTGKSPQTEYLIRLLKDAYQVATLSRGYKRKSKGFILADETANANSLGDEPYQFYTKFPEINVAVDANRVEGVQKLLEIEPRPEVIVLDDAYQHRRLKAGFYILLTAYGDIYPDDYLLPAGNLRESRLGASRANIIIVTKCPPDLGYDEQEKIIRKIRPLKNQKVFFSSIGYDASIYSSIDSIAMSDARATDKVLVAGIAKPEPFFSHLFKNGDVKKAYPDHHDFSESELEELKQISENKIIVTTEKDYMRLKGKLPAERLYYLPIRAEFISGGNDFDNIILNYVGKSTANR